MKSRWMDTERVCEKRMEEEEQGLSTGSEGIKAQRFLCWASLLGGTILSCFCITVL